MIIIMFRIVFVSKYEKSCQHLMDNCHFSKCRLMIFTTFLNIGRPPVSPVSASPRVHFLEMLGRHKICRGGYSPAHHHQGQRSGQQGPGPCQPSERLILLLITIYGNRIRAELELNIDGSDWVGCVGQTENNKLCRKFVKSQNISIFTLCFCF